MKPHSSKINTRTSEPVFAVFAAILFLVAPAVPAQDAADANAETPTVDAEEQAAMDEITVVGPRTLVTIERQIERADLEMYNIANSLIDDPLYKTYCSLETSPGTNIKRRVCAPGYERELLADSWNDEELMRRAGEGNFTSDYRLPQSELRKHRENMRQKMIELASQNPKLASAIYRRAELQREYEAARAAKRQKDE